MPLLLILLALIVRGVAFEYRHKHHDQQWRRGWDLAIIIGSFVPALLWGVAFANILRGVPIDSDLEYVGGFFNLLNPYALLGGLTTLLLFLTHGSVFVALKTDGEIRHRAGRLGVARRRGGRGHGGLPPVDPDRHRDCCLGGCLRPGCARARRRARGDVAGS